LPDVAAVGSVLWRLALNGLLRGWRPFFCGDEGAFPGSCEGGGGGGKLLMSS